MGIFKLDEFWAMILGLALLVLNETAGIPHEIILVGVGLIGGWLGKSGLATWVRRLQKGKEQYEANKPKKGKK
jgi:hypothetical protein